MRRSFFLKDRYYLYYATRTPDYSTQIIGVAMAPAHTDFSKQAWKSPVNHPVLVPEYPWEEKCVEGASVVRMGDEMFMFYAGAYNNRPQQIGVAKSSDGIHWTKLSNKPFLMNGDPGTWNCCESGHPHLFKTRKGKTYLFYQGNDDFGKTWFLSNMEVKWKNRHPFIAHYINQKAH